MVCIANLFVLLVLMLRGVVEELSDIVLCIYPKGGRDGRACWDWDWGGYSTSVLMVRMLRG